MRNLITFVGLIFVTSCTSNYYTHPVDSSQVRMFVQCTYVPGANITLPRPRQSQFFKVSDAGFLILKNKDAAYYIRGSLSEGRVKPYFVRVEYDNPQDESQPFENEADLTPDKNYAVFTSPDAVWGIHYWKTYTIRVSIFDNRESKQPIDTIVQPLRSYVDTTSGEVRIDNHLTTEPPRPN